MKRILSFLFVLSISLPAFAHIGSPDVFVETAAGPYKLYVTVRPPQVIPGVATIDARVSGAEATAIAITPMPLTGEGANHPPTPDQMHRSAQDLQFFTGSLWLMQGGSWQVRYQVDGAAGKSVVSVPLPAVPLTTLKMTRNLGILLTFLGLLLVAGLIGICGAALREAQLPPAAQLTIRNRKRGLIATAISAVVLAAIVWLGGIWWDAEASAYANHVYRPTNMHAALGAGVLNLSLSEPVTEKRRPWYTSQISGIDNFIPDHNHLMHLYAVRWPAMDVVYHLHPNRTAPGTFQLSLPSMPPGDYHLYADLVHASGFPETLTTHIEIPEHEPGRPLIGDDAEAHAQPLTGNEFPLPDGFRMLWDQPASLTARKAYEFRFHLLDKAGNPPPDMTLYMGMNGHAAFIKDDGSVFAHVHPSGTASMAAMMLAAQQNGQDIAMPATPSDTVAFPYGFPSPGRYRIIVQMKHSHTIETGIFDATVNAAQ